MAFQIVVALMHEDIKYAYTLARAAKLDTEQRQQSDYQGAEIEVGSEIGRENK